MLGDSIVPGVPPPALLRWPPPPLCMLGVPVLLRRPLLTPLPTTPLVLPRTLALLRSSVI